MLRYEKIREASHLWPSKLFSILRDRMDGDVSGDLGSHTLKMVSESPLATQPGTLNWILLHEQKMHKLCVESLRFGVHLLLLLELP